MERVCFLHKVKQSRIIFDVIRQELNIEDMLIENNPYNLIKSKCIVIMENKNTQVLAASTIYDGMLHFTLDVYKRGYRVKRIPMFGYCGQVNYDFTRKCREDFEKDCASEFWKAYDKLPIYLK